MKKPNSIDTPRICSVARTIDILGDRWIFLILREAFFGVRYYDQFLSNLGIATNMLSNRLKRLVENGIMEKNKDSTDSRRMTYRLTEKGRDLYPVTLAFMQWGDRWLADEKGPPLLLFHVLSSTLHILGYLGVKHIDIEGNGHTRHGQPEWQRHHAMDDKSRLSMILLGHGAQGVMYRSNMQHAVEEIAE